MSLILLGILNSQAAAAGGAGAYDLLETQVLTSNAANITFTGLGSYDYKHLQIRYTARSNDSNDNILLYFNADETSGNYKYHALRGTGSAVSSNADFQFLDSVQMSAADAGDFAAGVIDILDFSSTNKNTTVRALTGRAGYIPRLHLHSMAWFSTAAVTSLKISFSGTAVTGSRFSLYGIKGA